uniref:Protein kinase domain-containing protein n=1 Tax=Chromera velia CCMP2878 TaxID=1169474 RepID=A0A0G4HBT8_9ALVE|eukprot:Cvel_918.t1-p1 / transcript=Cvel_918.t1 / gene=Cvel_918 / organism=Chromera_velia_CCMP2878 / gene_product=Serine/threonine-protein kinase AFC2, putative / transcript_product=Serine/threonine-protein kinase AFC2, putative / location=Cvel_scaffold29:54822-66313(+) / protein_length=2191 / sequence_SO=supercontig / SO=protein_coding / is_pseudo=false
MTHNDALKSEQPVASGEKESKVKPPHSGSRGAEGSSSRLLCCNTPESDSYSVRVDKGVREKEGSTSMSLRSARTEEGSASTSDGCPNSLNSRLPSTARGQDLNSAHVSVEDFADLKGAHGGGGGANGKTSASQSKSSAASATAPTRPAQPRARLIVPPPPAPPQPLLDPHGGGHPNINPRDGGSASAAAVPLHPQPSCSAEGPKETDPSVSVGEEQQSRLSSLPPKSLPGKEQGTEKEETESKEDTREATNIKVKPAEAAVREQEGVAVEEEEIASVEEEDDEEKETAALLRERNLAMALLGRKPGCRGDAAFEDGLLEEEEEEGEEVEDEEGDLDDEDSLDEEEEDEEDEEESEEGDESDLFDEEEDEEDGEHVEEEEEDDDGPLPLGLPRPLANPNLSSAFRRGRGSGGRGKGGLGMGLHSHHHHPVEGGDDLESSLSLSLFQSHDAFESVQFEGDLGSVMDSDPQTVCLGLRLDLDTLRDVHQRKRGVTVEFSPEDISKLIALAESPSACGEDPGHKAVAFPGRHILLGGGTGERRGRRGGGRRRGGHVEGEGDGRDASSPIVVAPPLKHSSLTIPGLSRVDGRSAALDQKSKQATHALATVPYALAAAAGGIEGEISSEPVDVPAQELVTTKEFSPESYAMLANVFVRYDISLYTGGGVHAGEECHYTGIKLASSSSTGGRFYPIELLRQKKKAYENLALQFSQVDMNAMHNFNTIAWTLTFIGLKGDLELLQTPIDTGLIATLGLRNPHPGMPWMLDRESFFPDAAVPFIALPPLFRFSPHTNLPSVMNAASGRDPNPTGHVLTSNGSIVTVQGARFPFCLAVRDRGTTSDAARAALIWFSNFPEGVPSSGSGTLVGVLGGQSGFIPLQPQQTLSALEPVRNAEEWYPQPFYEGSYTESYFHDEDMRFREKGLAIPNYLKRKKGRSFLDPQMSYRLKTLEGGCVKPMDYFSHPEVLEENIRLGRLRGRVWFNPRERKVYYYRRFDRKRKLGQKSVLTGAPATTALDASAASPVGSSSSSGEEGKAAGAGADGGVAGSSEASLTFAHLRIAWHTRYEDQLGVEHHPVHPASGADGPHYGARLGDVIADRWLIRGVLGTGTFGRVFDVWDMERRKSSAAKVVRANSLVAQDPSQGLNMLAAAAEEARALSDVCIAAQYEENAHLCDSLVNMQEAFPVEFPHQIAKPKPMLLGGEQGEGEDELPLQQVDEKGFPLFGYETEMQELTHYCLMFDRLGCSLAQYLNRESAGRGMWLGDIARVVWDLVRALRFLHQCSMVHGDLKLQNIAFEDPMFYLCPHPRRWRCSEAQVHGFLKGELPSGGSMVGPLDEESDERTGEKEEKEKEGEENEEEEDFNDADADSDREEEEEDEEEEEERSAVSGKEEKEEEEGQSEKEKKKAERKLKRKKERRQRARALRDLHMDRVLALRPRNCRVKVLDLGNATQLQPGELGNFIINTRQYRAPEVVLNIGWDYQSDMWALGCMIAEMYTGRELMPALDDDLEHLAMMERVLGERIPEALVKAAIACKSDAAKLFDPDTLRLKWPELATPEAMQRVDSCIPLPRISLDGHLLGSGRRRAWAEKESGESAVDKGKEGEKEKKGGGPSSLLVSSGTATTVSTAGLGCSDAQSDASAVVAATGGVVPSPSEESLEREKGGKGRRGGKNKGRQEKEKDRLSGEDSLTDPLSVSFGGLSIEKMEKGREEKTDGEKENSRQEGSYSSSSPESSETALWARLRDIFVHSFASAGKIPEAAKGLVSPPPRGLHGFGTVQNSSDKPPPCDSGDKGEEGEKEGMQPKPSSSSSSSSSSNSATSASAVAIRSDTFRDAVRCYGENFVWAYDMACNRQGHPTLEWLSEDDSLEATDAIGLWALVRSLLAYLPDERPTSAAMADFMFCPHAGWADLSAHHGSAHERAMARAKELEEGEGDETSGEKGGEGEGAGGRDGESGSGGHQSALPVVSSSLEAEKGLSGMTKNQKKRARQKAKKEAEKKEAEKGKELKEKEKDGGVPAEKEKEKPSEEEKGGVKRPPTAKESSSTKKEEDDSPVHKDKEKGEGKDKEEDRGEDANSVDEDGEGEEAEDAAAHEAWKAACLRGLQRGYLTWEGTPLLKMTSFGIGAFAPPPPTADPSASPPFKERAQGGFRQRRGNGRAARMQQLQQQREQQQQQQQQPEGLVWSHHEAVKGVAMLDHL